MSDETFATYRSQCLATGYKPTCKECGAPALTVMNDVCVSCRKHGEQKPATGQGITIRSTGRKIGQLHVCDVIEHE